MVILQLGKAKSGNFWLYRILQEVLDICNIQKKSYVQQHPIYEVANNWDLSHNQQAGMDVISIESDVISLRIGNNFKEEIKDFDTYLSKCTHVWSHSMWNEGSMQIYKKFDKLIYIVRDPRDIALSMAKFAFTPYMLAKNTHREISPASYLQNRLYGSTLSWVQHVGQHLLHKDELDIHFVFYERLLHSFEQEVLKLLDYLDLDLSKRELKMLKDKVSFRTMKKQFPQHVRKGSSYKWVGVLSEKQVSIVRDIAGPILKTLNYPMDDELENYELPKLPDSINPAKINRALKASKGGLSTKLQYIYYFAKSRRPMKEKVEKAVKFFLSKPVQ